MSNIPDDAADRRKKDARKEAPMSHEDGCGCYSCEHGAGSLVAWEIEATEKYGWFSHYVGGKDEANIHTHGLVSKHGHVDLQLVIPVPQKTAQMLFWSLVDKIAEGRTFEAGEVVGEVLQGYDITFANAEEQGRRVLRLILPDKDGNLQPEESDPQYAAQWQGTL